MKTQPYQKADVYLEDLGCALCPILLQHTDNIRKIITKCCVGEDEWHGGSIRADMCGCRLRRGENQGQQEL